MTDYIADSLNGFNHSQSLIAPDDSYGIFFQKDGTLKIVADPLSASPVVVMNFTTSGKLDFLGSSGGASSAFVIGAGSSGSPSTSSTAGNFLSFYNSTSATSGDTRGLYVRLYFTGAGASGEAARLYTTVSNVTVATGGTVNGAHVSLSVAGASGKISGAGQALRCTLEVAAASTAVGGTVAVLRLDTSMATGAGLPATASFIAVDNLDSVALNYLFNITNASTGSGSMFPTSSSTTITNKLKIRVNGTDYWIALTSAV